MADSEDAIILLDPGDPKLTPQDLRDHGCEVVDALELGVEDDALRGDYCQQVREILDQLATRLEGR